MPADELRSRLHRGDVVQLLFDTNAIEQHRRFNRLCDHIHRLNNALRPDAGSLSMYVSATSHAEKLFHLKQKFSDDYDINEVMGAVQRSGLEILPFNAEHARVAAEFLGARFKDRDAWKGAKRQRCLQCLGVRAEQARGRNCSATIDWLIAAHALAEGCFLITEDRGPEFQGIRDRMSLGILENTVKDLLATLEMEANE